MQQIQQTFSDDEGGVVFHTLFLHVGEGASLLGEGGVLAGTSGRGCVWEVVSEGNKTN